MEGTLSANSPSANEGAGWWSSWLYSAREKSMSALTATKRDLAEFVTVLGSDTKTAVSGASRNIQGLLDTPEQGGKDGSSSSKSNTPPSSIDAPLAAPYDRPQAQLFAVQNSVDTYMTDPKGEKFGNWKAKFSVQAQQSDISNLLVTCPHIRSLHSQLVPAKVSYETFWMRYFYKVQLLEQEEKLRAELMARACKRSEHQLQWDEEFEEVGNDGLNLVPKPEMGMGHQRSESSSDSFVCVSESATNERERSQESLEPGSWEMVDRDSRESSGSPASQSKSKGFDIENLLVDDSVDDTDTPGATDTDVLNGSGVDSKGQGTEEDSNSDWEDWND